MNNHYDMIIVGGGLVGASLACALAPLNRKIALIDAQAFNTSHHVTTDTRSIALSDSSRRIFSALGLWEQLASHAAPIERIHLSQKGYFGKAVFACGEAKIDAFGFVISAAMLNSQLQFAASALPNTSIFAPAKLEKIHWQEKQVTLSLVTDQGSIVLTTPLVIAADGVNSMIRQEAKIGIVEKQYKHATIACNVELAQENTTAYERFTDDGAIAFLPLLGKQAASALTVQQSQLAAIMQLSDADYLALLQQQFGFRLGKFLKVGRRQSYPLRMLHATKQTQARLVLLGNAAHALHPIAAQGFNLGLRDVACLAQFIADQTHLNVDLGAENILGQYENMRLKEQKNMMRFTDTLARLCDTKSFLLKIGRGLSFSMMEFLPIIKDKVAQFGMGHFRDLPYLALGVGLSSQTKSLAKEQHEKIQ
jgi:2-octaprenyl-6-methoxyphenol hydroxylase